MRKTSKKYLIFALFLTSVFSIILLLYLTGCSNSTIVVDGVTYSQINGSYCVSDYDDDMNQISILEECNGKKVTKIGEYAFKGASNLITINIPNSVTDIGVGAFIGCHNLSSVIIPNEVKEIRDYTFYNCYNLKSVSLGENVKTINRYAFYGCEELEAIDCSMVIKFNEFAFSNCIKLKRFVIPDGIKIIPESLFQNDISLTEVIIPASVNVISKEAFMGCESLSTINLPNITVLYKYTFYKCSNLKEIVLPESLKEIQCGCFSECNSLENVTFMLECDWYALDKTRIKINVSDKSKVLSYLKYEQYSFHKSI